MKKMVSMRLSGMALKAIETLQKTEEFKNSNRTEIIEEALVNMLLTRKGKI